MIAESLDLDVDEALAIHAGLLTYDLQTAAEQGIALLGRLCEQHGRAISNDVLALPEHMRFGVPNSAALVLARAVRHRRACVALGESAELAGAKEADGELVLAQARALLDDTQRWVPILGRLVLANTRHDLRRYAGPPHGEEE